MDKTALFQLTVEQTEILLAELDDISNKIMLYKPFVRYFGSLDLAIVLSEIYIWTQITKRKYPERGGWFYRTYVDWEERIGLNEYSIRKSTKQLENANYIETKIAKAHGNPTCHYRSVLGKILNLMVSLNFEETNIENLQKRKLKIERNNSANFEESVTDYTTKVTSNTTTLLPLSSVASSSLSSNSSRPRKHKCINVSASDVIDAGLLERMTIGTPFSCLTPDSLSPAIVKFGIEKVLAAVDIATWRRLLPKETPEQYIYGMCSNGLGKPSGFKPFAEREADTIARQHLKVAEKVAKVRKDAEEAETGRLQEEQAQAEYEALPFAVRTHAEEIARVQYPGNPILRKWACREIGKRLAKEGKTAEVFASQPTATHTMELEERLALLREQAAALTSK